MSKLSGKKMVLSTKDYEASIVSVGAGLAGLTYKGHAIVSGHSADTIARGHQGKVLIPWPNRLYQGRFDPENRLPALPINDPATPSAIHGLCAWQDWSSEYLAANCVRLTSRIAAREAYPFFLEAQAVYTLSDAAGLEITLSVSNLGPGKAPAAIGMHPYLCADNEPIDGCQLQLPAVRRLSFDEHYLIRQEQSDTDDARRFARPALIGNFRCDDCYENTAGEPYTVSLTGSEVMSVLKASSPYLQMYTAEKLGRRAFAAEPMTAPVNAFNQRNFNDYLATGQTLSLHFSISGKLVHESV